MRSSEETILSLESLLESIKKVNLQCKSWGFELNVVKGWNSQQVPKQSVGLLSPPGSNIGAPKLLDGKRIKELYMKGYSVNSLARKYEVSASCVYLTLKRHQCPIRQRRSEHPTGGTMSASCVRVFDIIKAHSSGTPAVMSYTALRKLCNRESLSTMEVIGGVKSLETRKLVTKSDDLIQLTNN